MTMCKIESESADREYKPSEEAYILASAVLKYALKTSVTEASRELEMLFHTPRELQTRRHIHDKLHQVPEHLQDL